MPADNYGPRTQAHQPPDHRPLPHAPTTCRHADAERKQELRRYRVFQNSVKRVYRCAQAYSDQDIAKDFFDAGESDVIETVRGFWNHTSTLRQYQLRRVAAAHRGIDVRSQP